MLAPLALGGRQCQDRQGRGALRVLPRMKAQPSLLGPFPLFPAEFSRISFQFCGPWGCVSDGQVTIETTVTVSRGTVTRGGHADHRAREPGASRAQVRSRVTGSPRGELGAAQQGPTVIPAPFPDAPVCCRAQAVPAGTQPPPPAPPSLSPPVMLGWPWVTSLVCFLRPTLYPEETWQSQAPAASVCGLSSPCGGSQRKDQPSVAKYGPGLAGRGVP